MKLKKVLLGAVAIVGAAVLVACGSSNKDSNTSDKWDTYESDKSITIGFDNTFVPMGYEDDKGQNVGFDIDLANAVFAEYGIKVKWQSINWDMKETELNNGTIDLIWNGYSVTDERQEKVLFTDPYMMNVSSRPMMKPPSAAPGIIPIPPKTAATKAFIPGVIPINGFIVL